MSRTDKDRPRWVRNNDSTLRMEYQHNHVVFGSDQRWLGSRSTLTYKYLDHCTAFEKTAKRSDYVDGDVYGEDNNGTRQLWEYPCVRYEARDKNDKWRSGPSYPTSKMRPRERDFLKAQVKTYNSNYYLRDDLDFMNEGELLNLDFYWGKRW